MIDVFIYKVVKMMELGRTSSSQGHGQHNKQDKSNWQGNKYDLTK